MFFSEELIESIKDEPVAGTIKLCDLAFEQLSLQSDQGWQPEDYQILLETVALILEIMDSGLISIRVLPPPITGGGGGDECQQLYSWISSFRGRCQSEASKVKLGSLRSRFKTALGMSFMYEFSQGDLEKIQNLINELRENISAAPSFQAEHRQRLLKRLERLQTEIHKKVSDLDRFWGLVGEAGVMLGKLGNDAKPLVDRIREIAEIVWQTQYRAEELPSGTKLPQLETGTSSTEKGSTDSA